MTSSRTESELASRTGTRLSVKERSVDSVRQSGERRFGASTVRFA